VEQTLALQTRVPWHGWVALHEAPSAAGVTQTLGLPVQTEPGAHWLLLLQVVPALGTAAQAPQVWPAATLQKAVAHCDESEHAMPVASIPGTARHGAGALLSRSSSHDAEGSAWAQLSRFAAVRPVPGAATALESDRARRELHVVTSP
jgi:hypothetical protein